MKYILIIILLINTVFAQVNSGSPTIDNNGYPISGNTGEALTANPYPACLSNKVLWLDFTQPVNIGYYLDINNKITKPIDLSGIANITVQTTESQRATLTNNIINGLSGAVFIAGSLQYYSMSALSTTLPLTISGVVSSNTSITSPIIGYSGSNRHQDIHQTNINWQQSSLPTNCTMTSNNFIIFIIVVTSTTTTFYKNGILYCTNAYVSNNGVFDYIGRSSTSYANINLCEYLIINNTAYSGTNLQNLWNYYSRKYNITLYTDNVPYFNPNERYVPRLKDTYGSTIHNEYDNSQFIYNYNREAIRNEEDYI